SNVSTSSVTAPKSKRMRMEISSSRLVRSHRMDRVAEIGRRDFSLLSDSYMRHLSRPPLHLSPFQGERATSRGAAFFCSISEQSEHSFLPLKGEDQGGGRGPLARRQNFRP